VGFLSELILILSEILTFGGIGRLKEAKDNYNLIYEKYDVHIRNLNSVYDENRRLLIEIGSEAKGAFKTLQKAMNILSKINAQQRESIKELSDSLPIANQIGRVRRLNDRFSNVLSAGIGAAGGSALTAGSWALVSVLGAASTGTAISTLSGVAATNATLAWFGGGALATGGAGIAGGSLVLGGLFASPLILIWGFGVHKKARKLEEGYKIIESKLIELDGKEKAALEENITIKSKHEEINRICCDLVASYKVVSDRLYPNGVLSGMIRSVRKLLGGDYFRTDDLKLVDRLGESVDRFLLAFDAQYV